MPATCSVSSRNGTASTRKPRQPELQPEADDLRDLLAHRGAGDVEVRLVLVEAVQVVRLASSSHSQLLSSSSGKTRSPGSPRAARPARRTSRGRASRVGARRLEPGMLLGGVVDHEVGDHPHAPVARGADQLDEVAEAAEPRVDRVVVGDVVAVVAVGGRLERHQPEAVDAQPVEMVEPLDEPVEVADAVAVAVLEGLDVQAVEDRVLPPEVAGPRGRHAPSPRHGRQHALAERRR